MIGNGSESFQAFRNFCDQLKKSKICALCTFLSHKSESKCSFSTFGHFSQSVIFLRFWNLWITNSVGVGRWNVHRVKYYFNTDLFQAFIRQSHAIIIMITFFFRNGKRKYIFMTMITPVPVIFCYHFYQRTNRNKKETSLPDQNIILSARLDYFIREVLTKTTLRRCMSLLLIGHERKRTYFFFFWLLQKKKRKRSFIFFNET